jgi:hypothetical protein
MKAYLVVTAAIFGAIVVAHVLRIITESTALATQPPFIALTVISALLCGWGIRLYVGVARNRV